VIRKVTDADVPVILERLKELDRPSIDEAVLRREVLPDREQTILIDDEAGTICRIEGTPRRRRFAVVWLLPEGVSRGRLAVILIATIEAVFQRYARRRRWRIEAAFEQGKDAGGVPDKGAGATLAWQEFCDTGRTATVDREYDSDRKLWVAGSELGVIRDRLREITTAVTP
jgi:hypothetical protein